MTLGEVEALRHSDGVGVAEVDGDGRAEREAERRALLERAALELALADTLREDEARAEGVALGEAV